MTYFPNFPKIVSNSVNEYPTQLEKTIPDDISILAQRDQCDLNLSEIDTQCIINSESDARELKLFEDIYRQTEEHKIYLACKGLEERAQNIKVSKVGFHNYVDESIDLTPFHGRSTLPKEIIDFDPKAKNTVITTDPSTEHNRSEDLETLLDIRLYPTLRHLIRSNSLEVFLGSEKEMFAFYASKGFKILFEFKIPSSATYYLAQSEKGDYCMVMGKLVSKENVIAQLLTLKLAGVKLESIEIVGEMGHFKTLVKKDMEMLFQQMPQLKNGDRILIIAGCGLEEKISNIINDELNIHHGSSQSFQGNILSLIHTPLDHPVNGIHGCISLNLSYGEIMEEIVTLLLENCHCPWIFSGGACGYISKDPYEEKPPIGKRLTITQCMNEEGEVVSLNDNELSPDSMHLQVASIFLETYEWLNQAKERGSSVDVESFYILKAIQCYNLAHPFNRIEADCGCFISDYVGEQSLRDYSKVFHAYAPILSEFLQRAFIGLYQPKEQVVKDIIIRHQVDDPRVPHAPKLNMLFLSDLPSEDKKADFCASIKKLNPTVSEKELFTNKLWNIEYYNRENYPTILGVLKDQNAFSKKLNDIGLRFLDMPIYMPGQGWGIPPELSQFQEMIEKSMFFEKCINPDFLETCYVYITVDQGVVEPHKAQRRVGWHGDSYLRIDSNKRDVEIACDHIYVATDCCPTPFLPGPFSLDDADPESLESVLAAFAKQAEGKAPHFYSDYTLLRADPYCVHNVGFNQTEQTIFRTFVKISVSQSKYCKLGNAHNPLFTYDWPLVPRQNVPYSKTALKLSSHRKDRDRFREINPKVVDFSRDICKIDWLQPTIRTAVRKREIKVQLADEGQVLRTYNDGFLTSIFVAEKGDWKVTSLHGDEYYLSNEKLHKLYDADPNREGVFLPKPIPRRVAEIKENIRIPASWGSLQYGREGDMLVCIEKNDVYIVPRSLFDAEYN